MVGWWNFLDKHYLYTIKVLEFLLILLLMSVCQLLDIVLTMDPLSKNIGERVPTNVSFQEGSKLILFKGNVVYSEIESETSRGLQQLCRYFRPWSSCYQVEILGSLKEERTSTENSTIELIKKHWFSHRQSLNGVVYRWKEGILYEGRKTPLYIIEFAEYTCFWLFSHHVESLDEPNQWMDRLRSFCRICRQSVRGRRLNSTR